MFLRREAERQDLSQGVGFAALRRDHVNEKIVAAEFPHHLTAHAAGRERPGDDAVLSAAHGDGGKVPVSVVDRLEEGGALGADRGAVTEWKMPNQRPSQKPRSGMKRMHSSAAPT